LMEFIAGETLEARIERRGALSAEEMARLVPALLDGVEAVHEAGFLHRDIKPSNIMLRAAQSGDSHTSAHAHAETPVLIDFGAARAALSAHSHALTAILSEGYAPYEQYQRDSDQGCYTDIYALGATLYRCIAGKRPPPALDRIANKAPVEPAAELGQGDYDPALLKAIDASLAIRAEERPQDVAAFRALMRGGAGATAPPPPAGEPGATLVAGVPSSVKAGLYAAEPGATLVAGDAPGVPPAMAREAKPRPKPAPPRPHAPANNGAPAKSGGLGQMLANLQPKHLAIIAVAIFATLILMLVLLVVLLARQ
jgi:serine/threonine protein kinase